MQWQLHVKGSQIGMLHLDTHNMLWTLKTVAPKNDSPKNVWLKGLPFEFAAPVAALLLHTLSLMI